jgi:hypothetical protein
MFFCAKMNVFFHVNISLLKTKSQWHLIFVSRRVVFFLFLVLYENNETSYKHSTLDLIKFSNLFCPDIKRPNQVD